MYCSDDKAAVDLQSAHARSTGHRPAPDCRGARSASRSFWLKFQLLGHDSCDCAFAFLQAFENYLQLARLVPTTPSDWSVNEEALKCLVNSVYSRLDFVTQHVVPKGYLSQLLDLAKVCLRPVDVNNETEKICTDDWSCCISNRDLHRFTCSSGSACSYLARRRA